MTDSKSIGINLSLIGNVRVNFYGFAYEIIKIYEKENEFERQKKIKHLGLISEIIESSHHTRYEYLMFQCFLVDVIENTYKGTSNAIGSIKIDGKSYHGNSIIKTWFLLSNFGHTFNTFGDEKTLLLFTYERKGFLNKLLSDIEDEELKNYAKKVIEKFNYPSFHHILSIWRIYKTVKNKVKKKQILKIYKLFLLDSTSIKINKAKLDLLKHLAKYAREIALISIDGHNTHIPFTINPLSTLMSIDVYESKLKNNSVFNVLNPLSSILINEIYLEEKVLTKQRTYEINSLIEIKKRKANYAEYGKIIDEAFIKGLRKIDTIELVHFFRFKIERALLENENILTEYRNIQTVKRNCSNIEASLDYNPISKEKIYDFYYNKDFNRNKFPVFLFNILSVLEQQINLTIKSKSPLYSSISEIFKEQLVQEKIPLDKIEEFEEKSRLKFIESELIDEIDKVNIPTFRNLLSSILSYLIDSKYTFEITEINTPYDYIAVKLANVPYDNISINIDKAINSEKDLDRIHELKHLLKLVPKKFDGFIICSLCRINIYDYSKPTSGRLVTDIDSLIIKINANEMIIEFNESKNMKKKAESTAEKELKNNFVKVLNKNSKGYRITKVTGYGAKVRLRINAM
jgi:hypothetical protein